MKIPERFRTLRAYTVLWVILPLALVTFSLIALGIFAYQRVLTTLLVERHRQIAATAAVSVSEVIDGYGRILEALASNPDIRSDSAELRETALESAADALEVFNAGVLVTNHAGQVISFAPAQSRMPDITKPLHDSFLVVQVRQGPVFSDVLTDQASGEELILVGVPLMDDRNRFSGSLMGALWVRTATLSHPVRRLRVGSDGFAYLVDGKGRVIYHPDEEEIGKNYASLPFFRQILGDQSGGTLWRTPNGDRLIEADAPVTTAGWDLIVEESWDSAIAPTQPYSLATIGIGLFTVLIVVLISWQGVRKIVLPIRLLVEQTEHISRGEALETFNETGIVEIDGLERSFDKMARQINAYRAGLRRYIDAITRSQEEERQRISHELHDETVQNLLAVSRRIELYQGTENDPGWRQRLKELQTVITDTLAGVRQISRDLRPLILEDLGLIPALQHLVSGIRQGEGALPHALFEVQGKAVLLTPEQELALYRVTQEALNNVRKHARATGVWVELSFENEQVHLEITDNGIGFQAPESLADLTQRGRFGLMGIQERIWSMDGVLAIHTSPSHGTKINISIPAHNT